MVDSTLVTQEEMALRRRARRRLVGAVAIALTAVVVLPMVFDPEPKPLGPEVDLHIPAKDSPFEASPAAPQATAQPAAPEPAPRTAEPTQPETQENPAPQPATVPAAGAAARPPETKPAEAKPTEVKPVSDDKAQAPAAKEIAKPSKSEAKAERKAEVPAKPATQKTEAKPDAKAPPKADPAFASRGYYLQLGAFGSEINARQLQTKAQAAGFKVGLTGANGQFRVRVGPIAEHDKALEMQAKLKAKGFSPVLLGP